MILLKTQEFNRKDVEITNLKFENKHLKNELKHENDFNKRFNKPKEYVRYYENLMRSQRRPDDTFGLGNVEHLSSSKGGE